MAAVARNPARWASGHTITACRTIGDGTSPLPVLLHFHGWGRQGDLIVNHRRIAGHTRRRGVLLVAPNGEGRTWRFWQVGGADVPFADAVLEDLARRYPLDRERLFVSGYSYGAAMAWRFACEAGEGGGGAAGDLGHSAAG